MKSSIKLTGSVVDDLLLQASSIECIVFQIQWAAWSTISCPSRYQLYQFCHQKQAWHNSVDDGLPLC